jgi:MFS family permease
MNWAQLQTILWLRWRLMCHQWRRTGGFGAVLTVIVIAAAVALGSLSFIGGLLGGWVGLAEQKPTAIMLAWLVLTLVFLFMWLAGLLTELQRSETIDLQKLMHLPVALGQMFVFNYLASLFAPSLVIAVPAMIGLSLGLALTHGPLMLLLIPLAVSMILMITSWTYCLRGWLSTLMANPRRRRTIIMFISLGFIIIAQGPNLYFNVMQRHFGSGDTRHQSPRDPSNPNRRFLENLVAVQQFVPPLWLPLGAKKLTEGNPMPALLGTLGCASLAALGLRRAYRNTVQFYQGSTDGRAAQPITVATATHSPATPDSPRRKRMVEWTVPFVPEQAAAVALATFRSLLRAPEVKISWAGSFIATIVLGTVFSLRAATHVPEEAKPFLATLAVVFPVFFLTHFFSNLFGFDRDGFRAYILSSADRRLILLGKNLAAWPVALSTGTLLVLLTSFRLNLPLPTVLATLYQLASVLLLASMAGNLLSLLVPYRIQAGSMKPTKLPGLAMLVLMFTQMLFPTAMLPVFIAPLLELLWHRLGWPDMVPVNLITSIALLALLSLIYWQSLGPLGRLLQRRETKILAVVSVEVE